MKQRMYVARSCFFMRRATKEMKEASMAHQDRVMQHEKAIKLAREIEVLSAKVENYLFNNDAQGLTSTSQ